MDGQEAWLQACLHGPSYTILPVRPAAKFHCAQRHPLALMSRMGHKCLPAADSLRVRDYAAAAHTQSWVGSHVFHENIRQF